MGTIDKATIVLCRKLLMTASESLILKQSQTLLVNGYAKPPFRATGRNPLSLLYVIKAAENNGRAAQGTWQDSNKPCGLRSFPNCKDRK